jgi:type IV pilus assembly protein PilW
MISVTLGLVIVSALLAVYVNSNSASNTNQNTSELVNNGRYALDVLKTDLRQAGFLGYTGGNRPDLAPNVPTTTITPVTNECLESGAAAGSFVTNIWQGVWGANDGNPFASGNNCLTGYARGDVLVVRRLEPIAATGTTVAALTPANRFYFRSNYANGEMFRAVSQTACPTGLFPTASYPGRFQLRPCISGSADVDLKDFPVVEHVYYIRSYTVQGESPQIPALVRVSLQTDGTFSSEVIAGGIENMQIQYGSLSSNNTAQYMDASAITGNSSSYSQTWANVKSVQVWLLARNASPEKGYSNTSAYPMGSASSTASDSYRRQLFSTVVQLRN